MLPLRLCLILAILAGIGVIVVSQVVVKPHVTSIIDARNDFNTKWTKAEEDKKKLNKDLNETRTTLQSTKADLEASKTAFNELQTTYTGEKKLSNERAAEIVKLKGEVKKKDDDLQRWAGVGLTIEQVLTLKTDYANLKAANEATIEESKIIAARAQVLKQRLDELLGGNVDPPVPDTVRGKVMVVDPKWDFVVLNIGSKDRVPVRGVLLISRNGTLVAKVRVLSVQNDRAIANIMPGWKLKDVLEGDLIFPYDPKNL